LPRPWRELADAAREVAVDETGEHVGEVGVRIDAVQLATLDQRGEDGPVLGTLVREVVMMRLSSLWRAKGIARGRI
jgi:hypothetical protein